MKQQVFEILDSYKIEQDKSREVRINEYKDYFNEFFHKYSTNNPIKFSEITLKEIIEALVYFSNPYTTREIKTFGEKYGKQFTKRNYIQLFQGFTTYYNNNNFSTIVDEILSNSIISKLNGAFELGYLCAELGLLTNAGTTFVKFINKNPGVLEEARALFENFDIKMINIGIEFYNACIVFNDIHQNDEKKNMYDFLPKHMKRSNPELLKKYKDSLKIFTIAINEFVSFLSGKYNEAIKEHERIEKERKRNNKNIDELKEALDVDTEIKNIDYLLSLCPSDEAKVLVVNFCIEHNKKVYESLVVEYEQAKQKSNENLSLLFAKYGYDFPKLNNEEQKQIKDLAYPEIESLLSRLNNLGLININILKVDISKLSEVEDLIAKGLINKEWLNSNSNILYQDNNVLEQVITNIDILSNNNINIIQYQNSLDILKSSNITFNLDLLKLYGLGITKATTNISFLGISDLRKRIEFIISLGLYQSIESLDILNYSLIDCYHLKISQVLNVPYESIGYNIKETICDLCPNIIPEYLESALKEDGNLIIDLPESLIEYQVNIATLNINGIFVSIEKVKRNLGKLGRTDLEACFYAIIFDGYYTLNEIASLKEVLLPSKEFYQLVRG